MLALNAAAVAALAVFVLPKLRDRLPAPAAPEPLTIQGANDLLANTSSWKAVIDDAGFGFRAPSGPLLPQHRSALNFLSQEDLSR